MRATPLSPHGPSGPRRAGPAWRLCLGTVHVCLRACIVGVLLAGVALGLLLLRLSQGPVVVPGIASLAEAALNDEAGDVRVAIGDAVLTLGAPGRPSGLWFRDVAIFSEEGEALVAAPRLVAHLDLADVLTGRLQPTEVELVEPRAQVLRARDGRIRVALTGGDGMVVAGGPEEAPVADSAAMDTVAAIVDGLVGDAEALPGLERLRTVEVSDATLVYVDERTGRRWRTRGSDFTLERTDGGVRARIRAALTDDTAGDTRITLTAERLKGEGVTTLVARFANLQADDLAEQVAELGWVRVLDAPTSGGVTLGLARNGDMTRLDGGLTARRGRLLGVDGPEGRFDRAVLRFAWEPEARRMAISRLAIEAESGELLASGSVIPEGEDPFAPDAVTAELTLESARADLPELFDGPLAFDEGAVVARASFDPPRIDLAEARLETGDMVLSAEGQARPDADGRWTLDLRGTGREVTVSDLLRHWPLGAAANARAWLSENLIEGRVPELVAEMRLAEGVDPSIDLSFRFLDVDSRYLKEMAPIRGASGRGQLTFDEFFLQVEEASVAPDPSRPIRLGGSRLRIYDLWEPVTPADIDIRATGPTAEALALLDQPPLGLVGRLGLDPRTVDGRVEVSARLGFPLLKALRVEEVEVEAAAVLRDADVALPLGTGEARRIRSDRLTLDSTTRRMTIAGPVTVDGIPLDVRWTERFTAGVGPVREISASGRVGVAEFERAGLPLPVVQGGSAAVTARIEDDGAGLDAVIEADLDRTVLGVEALRWRKPAGTPGRLVLEARRRDSGAVDIDRLSLEGGGLDLDGSLAFGPDGALREARLSRIALDGLADVSARVTPASDGATEITVEGPLLDLSDFLTDPPDTAPARGAPLRLDADIERLVITPKLFVAPARARLSRSGAGRIDLALSGSAAGRAPFEGEYRREAGSPGTMRVTSSDAGGLLSGLGLFQGGSGGKLALDARFTDGGADDVTGEIAIEDMTVRGASTFGEILEEGGVDDAAQAVEGGGLRFRSIDIPFAYSDGLIRLDSAIARSPALALKVEGTVDEQRDAIDLIGVATPAYGLTGALDKVPLLGTLLSGGKGEGLFAMTFSVGGTLSEPDFQVNPLSLLAPGALRNLFEHRADRPSDRFIDGVGGPQ